MDRLTIWKGWVAACAALIVCAAWALPAGAQYDPNTVPVVTNSRAMIGNSWSNLGVQGGNPEYGRGNERNAFPRAGTGPGSYGIVLSQFTSGPKSQVYNGYKTSMGDGIWILTADGKVGVTGARMSPWIGLYNVPLPYDPVGKPEENLGVPNPLGIEGGAVTLWQGGGDLAALSNYWPGIGPLDIGSMYRDNLNPAFTPPVQIANYNLHGYIEDRTEPEEIIIARWVDIKQGIQVTRRVYNWSNPDFDKFYIVDLEFTNTGDFDGDGAEDNPGGTAAQTMYIAFKNSWVSAAMGVQEAFGWDGYVVPRGVDDIYFYSDAPNYTGAVAPGYSASLFRDSDRPDTPWDDTGDPWFKRLGELDIGQTEGQLRAPSWTWMAPIAYADDAGIFSFNDRDKGKYVQPQGPQPYGAKWWQARSKTDFDDPFSENSTEAEMYAAMADQTVMPNPDESDPENHKFYIFAQVYGPYTLQAGESCKIVMAYGVGHPSQMKPDPSQGMGVMDVLAWDRSEDKVDNKIKEMKTLGEQAAFENIQLAHFVYDADYQIPAAPCNAFIAADNLTSSENAHQLIRWVDASDRAVNPWTGEQDIQGYRIYRSTWFGWGPWELWDTIPKGQSGQSINGKWTYANGMYEYEDLATAAGFNYHYSVRPYNRGYETWTSDNGKTIDDIPVARVRADVRKGFESGWGPPTARTYDADERRPFQPTSQKTDMLEKQVLVVPNPYFVDGKHQYPNSRNLRFVGIPRKCKIYIYTAAGDRVETLKHDDPTKGEMQFRQITWNIAGEIQTGLYYFVVVSETEGSMGKTQRGRFVVIK